ncbi:MAG: hypothetical protein JWS12_985 [Candidatus Saccharibacteria bacterium]|nr:hypothetical protein [Candidatus Saccharibacteria bacterium]
MFEKIQAYRERRRIENSMPLYDIAMHDTIIIVFEDWHIVHIDPALAPFEVPPPPGAPPANKTDSTRDLAEN